MKGWLPRLVTAAVVSVGVYDAAVGLWLLLSPTPWSAHGPGTSWWTLAESLARAPEADATLGLFRRMGAFSLHAGVCTVVWAALSHRRPWLRTALFATYLCTGMAFASTDARFFAGTPYLLAKRAIGAVFFAAFLGHLGLLRAEARRRAGAVAEGPTGAEKVP